MVGISSGGSSSSEDIKTDFRLNFEIHVFLFLLIELAKPDVKLETLSRMDEADGGDDTGSRIGRDCCMLTLAWDLSIATPASVLLSCSIDQDRSCLLTALAKFGSAKTCITNALRALAYTK